jgi:1-deoxy-D-xylulose-5-phosphate reductoisomerase
MKTINIFGATGSIGQSTADVILHHHTKFDVKTVTANTNTEKLALIARQLNAECAVIADESLYEELKTQLAGTSIKAMAGHEALLEAASIDVDITMAAIVGMAGLPPLVQSIKHSKAVAIANKEPLVAAGAFIMDLAKQHNTALLPTDSEHNAIFQVFESEQHKQIERIILTASGGPFRTYSKKDMRDITPEQAVAHPNWSMGAKISVDSATMMNKALEIIEAHHLFNMPADKIDVRVHPQSIIHSMVEYSDGSVLAQLGAPDMRTPITYCLGWPERIASPGQKLDWKTFSNLSFEDVNKDSFPVVEWAYECINAGQAACIAFNAANEMAVAAFLDKQISFLDIASIIRHSLDALPRVTISSINDVIEYDALVRKQTTSYINSHINNTAVK